MNLIMTLFNLVKPILQEYIESSVRKSTDISKLIMQITTFSTFVWLLLLVFHMTEQARMNIDIQKPLITQNKSLTEANKKLQKENQRLKRSAEAMALQLKEADAICEIKTTTQKKETETEAN